jgi:hypothetical protein
MVTTVITSVPTGIMAIGDTDTTALGPIADTGRAVHIVDGADRRFQKPDEISGWEVPIGRMDRTPAPSRAFYCWAA